MKKLQFLLLICILTFTVSCGQQKRYVSYKIQKGETMRDIANRLDMKTKDLLRLNPDVGRRPDANTVIVIPNPEIKKGTPSSSSGAWSERGPGSSPRARRCRRETRGPSECDALRSRPGPRADRDSPPPRRLGSERPPGRAWRRCCAGGRGTLSCSACSTDWWRTRESSSRVCVR